MKKYTIKTSYVEYDDLTFDMLENMLYSFFGIILTVECLNILKLYSTLTIKVDESLVQITEQFQMTYKR